MTPSYVLTQAAEADLRGIIRYTRREWGDAQVRSYIGKLKQEFERVSTVREGRIIDLTAVYPGLAATRCGHHYLFYLPQRQAPALIVAIFHERMDLMARLADRLGVNNDPV